MYTCAKIIDERTAVFTCSRCKQVVRIDATDFIRQPGQELELVCTCGHSNRAVFEYRASVRKSINIPGIYKISGESDKEKTGSLTVKDISWQGFKLEISSFEHCIKAHDLHCDRYKQESHHSQSIFVQNFLNKGDRITIEFFLDDPKLSFISRPVNIKWMQHDSIGVELCYPEEFEPSIRFYLLGLKMP